MDDLHRFAVVRGKSGAERFVSPDDFKKTFLQRSGVDRSVQPGVAEHIVGAGSGRELVEEPEPLLREGKGQGAAAGHALHRFASRALRLRGFAEQGDEFRFALTEFRAQRVGHRAGRGVEPQPVTVQPEFDVAFAEAGKNLGRGHISPASRAPSVELTAAEELFFTHRNASMLRAVPASVGDSKSRPHGSST